MSAIHNEAGREYAHQPMDYAVMFGDKPEPPKRTIADELLRTQTTVERLDRRVRVQGACMFVLILSQLISTVVLIHEVLK